MNRSLSEGRRMRSASEPPKSPQRKERKSDNATEVFVPGRICLFGEHSDWAGSFTRFNSEITPGMTIVCGTNQGLYARVKRHPTSLVITTTTDKGETKGPVELSMDVNNLLKIAQEGGFWSYAAGVAYKIATDYRVSGLEIHNYKTDLPLRKGLSSSAAFCVLVARAFNIMYDIKMTIRGEMEYAYQGELATPSRCGRMDQGCAYGSRPILMTYDGEFVGVDPIPLAGPPLHYVVVDLAGDKSTTEILAGLQAGYPFPRDEVAEGVHNLLGPLNKDISDRALKALEHGDGAALGALMKESQDGWDTLGRPACPSQLTAPLLHKVLGHPALQEHIHGGKGVGSQGDGTAQLLAKNEASQRIIMDIIRNDFQMDTLSLTISPQQGVRKAVIPAAGFTASMYPASKGMRLELFPVLDRDGYTKPAILLHVEELIGAGIEEVVIVVCPEDLEYFERLFHQPDTLENSNKLPKDCQRYAKQILSMGEKVRFVVQEKQEGFGHALLCAQAAIGDEPFLLMIGHHLYKAAPNSPPVATQMLAAYSKHRTSIVGLRATPAKDVSLFGTVGGVWIKDGEKSAEEHETSSGNLVEMVLADIGMATQYKEVFAQEKLLYSQLSTLTAEELKEMNIPLGHRKRMLAHFSTLPQMFRKAEDSREADTPTDLRITEVCEKPTQEYASQKLAMTDPPLEADTFLTMFGQYIIDPKIFLYLQENVSNNVRQGGEFGLSSCLDRLRKDQGLVGVCVEGERFNIGTPASFQRTVAEFSDY